MRTYLSHLSLLLMTLAINLGMTGVANASTAAGTVILAAGESWRFADSGREPLRRQAQVFAGDHLITADGSMTLRMQDDAIVNLQPHSEMIIHAYRPATDGQAAAIRFELKQGALRTRTGRIGEKAHHRYRLDTPFAALGIRGTDYTVNLRQDELSVYVHTGAIRLAPFSDGLGCLPGRLGACDTPEAMDLSSSDNAWLRLQRGDGIERISGAPDFISEMNTPAVFSAGLYDAQGKALTPAATHEQILEFVERDEALPDSEQSTPPLTEQPGLELDGLRDALLLDPSGDTDGDGLSDEYELANNLNPWLADMDGDGLDDAVDPTPNRADTHLYKVDNRVEALTEAQIRHYLRHTTLKVDAYDPITSHSLYNLQLKLRQTLALNGWFDLDKQRLWGKTGSIETLLAARYWPEGLVWNALPESLGQVGGSPAGLEWLSALRQDQVALWQLDAGRHSIWFTPGEGPVGEGTRQFSTRWSQPLGNPAGHGAPARIRSFKADAEGRFQLEIGTQRYNYNLRGAVGEAGMLFAENDHLSLKGHWQGNTLVILITEKDSHQQWMFGLQQTGLDDSPLLAQWQSRETNGVTWGHWADFARLDEDKVAQLSRYGKTLAYNRHYALELLPADNLPTSGRVDFSLSDASAVYAGKDGLRPAEVINPMLQVDFDQKRFVSRFDVTAPGLDNSIAIQGAGSIDDSGFMNSEDALSNAQMQGGLGADGDSAALIFERDLGEDGHVSGITHWK